MQAFLRFRAVAVCGFALASALLLAVPASAASGPPVVGCITGSSCMIEINYYVTYSGSSGGSNGVVVCCTGMREFSLLRRRGLRRPNYAARF